MGEVFIEVFWNCWFGLKSILQVLPWWSLYFFSSFPPSFQSSQSYVCPFISLLHNPSPQPFAYAFSQPSHKHPPLPPSSPCTFCSNPEYSFNSHPHLRKSCGMGCCNWSSTDLCLDWGQEQLSGKNEQRVCSQCFLVWRWCGISCRRPWTRIGNCCPLMNWIRSILALSSSSLPKRQDSGTLVCCWLMKVVFESFFIQGSS